MRLDFSKIGVWGGLDASSTIVMHRDQVAEFLAACEDERIIWSSGDKPTEFDPVARENADRQWFVVCFSAVGFDHPHAVTMTYAAYNYKPAGFYQNWLLLDDIVLQEEEHENRTFEEWML